MVAAFDQPPTKLLYPSNTRFCYCKSRYLHTLTPLLPHTSRPLQTHLLSSQSSTHLSEELSVEGHHQLVLLKDLSNTAVTLTSIILLSFQPTKLSYWHLSTKVVSGFTSRDGMQTSTACSLRHPLRYPICTALGPSSGNPYCLTFRLISE